MRITNIASTLYSPRNGALVRDSSAVEQEAVNFEVAGSNPVPGAKHRPHLVWGFCLALESEFKQRPFQLAETRSRFDNESVALL